MCASPPSPWPDPLSTPDAAEVEGLLHAFWTLLRSLPELLTSHESLLAAQLIGDLRDIVLRMMLALNGIRYPSQTRNLNSYLSGQQRRAIERTYVAPTPEPATWLGQAVALVVIYRWYAPQLTAHYRVNYPQALEADVWAGLVEALPAWPRTVTTD